MLILHAYQLLQPSNTMRKSSAILGLQHWRRPKLTGKDVPKILVLAGTDRLDRSLTIGQMQGKFQMMVLRNTGHAIQEDVPDELARIILGFIDRNCITASGVKISSVLRAAQLRSGE